MINDQNENSPVISNLNNQEKKYQVLFGVTTILLIMMSLITVYLLKEMKEIKTALIKENQLPTTNTTNESPKVTTITEIPINPTSTPSLTATAKPMTDKEQLNSLACKRIGGCTKDTSIQVDKISGNYATGGTSSQGGGFAWFAVKINNTWKIVWETQDGMACQISEKYNIPSTMYSGACYSGYDQKEINKFINGLEN